VEGVLEEALARVLRSRPSLSAAGRTDAGVHARGQVVSLEIPGGSDLGRLQRAVNGMLAPELVLLSVSRARDAFDARRSAAPRHYRYRLDLAPVPDPFTARYEWHRPGELSLRAMRRAARDLRGEHDFASFGRPSERGGSTVRRLERLAVTRFGDRLESTARANGFLRQMVRSLVGTLVDVGEGRIDAEAMPEVLAARDRSSAGRLAPAQGLTLERVVYRSKRRTVL